MPIKTRVYTSLLLCMLILPTYAVHTPIKKSVKNDNLTYINSTAIERTRKHIQLNKPFYVNASKKVIQRGDKALEHVINPVTNKSAPAASQDIHDYLSLGPYWWPDTSKPDGLPWIRKDGVINMATRGNFTDRKRSKLFLHTLNDLNLAYIFSGDTRYLEKLKAMIDAWLVDPKTRMNPHLNYAQGIPGESTGRPFGVIEWENISSVVTAIELLKNSNSINTSFITSADTWLSDYLNWLLTSEIGQQAGATKNNHATWYNYQTIGLMLYLGRKQQAIKHLENIKEKQIDTQILPSGAQPLELARTKSVNYSSMNLLAFLKLSELGKKANIDLLHYKGPNGQSIHAAASYLIPYVFEGKAWEYLQLGTLTDAYNKKAIPVLYIANKLFNDTLLENRLNQQHLPYVKPEYILTF